MRELPKGWMRLSLRDLIGPNGLISDGDWVESKDQDPNGQIRLLQLADIGDGVFLDRSTRYVNEAAFRRLRCTELKPGDVLVARMPDPLGRACITPKLSQRAITVVDVAIVRLGDPAISPRWIKYFINSPEIRREIELLASGTTRRRISRSKLEGIELPVPPPQEQVRIATKLDSLLIRLSKCRERLDQAPELLRRFREAVLQAAVSGRLTKEWKREHQAGDWQRVLLGELIVDGPKNGLYKSKSAYGSGINILRIDSFYDGDVTDWSALKRLKITDQEVEEFGLMGGDIVINRVNSPPFVGKCALIRSISEPCVFESNMMRIRINRARIDTEYCMRFLCSPLGLSRLRRNVKHAVNQSSINQQDVSAVEVELPSLQEQIEIVARVSSLLSSAGRARAAHASALERVERLASALLSKTFRGELVAQDPGEEPASKMLERISAGQKTSNKTNMGKKQRS